LGLTTSLHRTCLYLTYGPRSTCLGCPSSPGCYFLFLLLFSFFFWRAQKLINYQHYYKDNNSYSVYLNYSYCHHFLHNCHLWWCSSHVGFFSSFFSKTNNNMLLIFLKAIKIVISTATILSSSLPWLLDCLETWLYSYF